MRYKKTAILAGMAAIETSSCSVLLHDVVV